MTIIASPPFLLKRVCMQLSRKRSLGMSKWASVSAKAGFSAILIWWLSGTVDWTRLKTTFDELRGSAIALAALCVIVQALILGLRWHRVIRFLGCTFSMVRAIHLVFVGMFFNQALPGSVGGDVLRIWRLKQSGIPGALAFSSVAIERGTGVALLGMMVSLCVPAIWTSIEPGLRIALLSCGPFLLLCLLVSAYRYRSFGALLPARAAELVTTLGAALGALGTRPRAITELIVLGTSAAFAGICSAYVVGLDLGIALSLPAYIALVGAATLISVLPISLGGWGVREASFVALFGMVGVAPERALTVSIMYGILPLLVSIPGGFSWWLREKDRASGSPQTLQREGQESDSSKVRL